MKSIIITDTIRQKCPTLVLGCIESTLQVKTDYPELNASINSTLADRQVNLEVEHISQIPTVKATREGYLACGKKPSRYRPSAEALLRRVAMGKGLYQVNNVVDLLNLVSINSGYSIGGYDVAKVQGDIRLNIGKQEPYTAIGRGQLNIEFLPVFRDDVSAFGSPTSDSLRTMVSAETTRFLMIILAFNGEDGLAEVMQEAANLLIKFADAKDIEQCIVRA